MTAPTPVPFDVVWVAVFADVGAGEIAQAVDFWAEATGTRATEPRGADGEWLPLLNEGEDAHLWVQRTMRDAGQAGWHLDFYVTDVRRAAAQAIQYGASAVRASDGLMVMSSPAGAAFCLVESGDEHRRAQPRAWLTGHRSLLDQVCIDIPAVNFENETRFWHSLTEWELRTGERDEFMTLVAPANVPVQVLLQRLRADDSGSTRMHVDFASDDVAAEVKRHQSIGATVVRVTSGWTTMRDPLGLLYCVTNHSFR